MTNKEANFSSLVSHGKLVCLVNRAKGQKKETYWGKMTVKGTNKGNICSSHVSHCKVVVYYLLFSCKLKTHELLYVHSICH